MRKMILSLSKNVLSWKKASMRNTIVTLLVCCDYYLESHTSFGTWFYNSPQLICTVTHMAYKIHVNFYYICTTWDELPEFFSTLYYSKNNQMSYLIFHIVVFLQSDSLYFASWIIIGFIDYSDSWNVGSISLIINFIIPNKVKDAETTRSSFLESFKNMRKNDLVFYCCYHWLFS